MNTIIIIVSVVLIVQVALFFLIRNRNRKLKKENVLFKYNIKSASDAFRLMQDETIPAEDRIKIEEYYRGNE